jgi:hypothetical protein
VRLQVICGRRDLGVGGGWVGWKVVIDRRVYLGADEVRARCRQRVEYVVPLRFVEDQHIVGRGDRLGAPRCADLLEQRVCVTQLHDTVDNHRGRRHTCPLDLDGVPRRDSKVRGRLLGHENSTIGAYQRANRTGEYGVVRGRNLQNHCCAGYPGTTAARCSEPRSASETDR